MNVFKIIFFLLGFVLFISAVYGVDDKSEGSASFDQSGVTEDALEEESVKVESEGEESQQMPQPGVASDGGSSTNKKKKRIEKVQHSAMNLNESAVKDENVKQQEESSGSNNTSGSSSGPIGASPNADAVLLFVKPTTSQFRGPQGISVPAGKPVNVLVGFTNKHNKEEGKSFVLNSMEAGFRYPQDYSFSLQNFSSLRINQEVEATHEATVEYTFTPAAQLAGRPFGLTMVLLYHDTDGKQFIHAVFNETVNVVEVDEGFDGETFFMYVFVVVISVLILFGVYHLITIYGSKKLKLKGIKKQFRNATGSNDGVEMGTNVNGDVDFNWLPKHTLDQMKANRSPKQSPRLRKTKGEPVDNNQ